MQPDWTIEFSENGINTIFYEGMDRFTAQWTTGDNEEPPSKDQIHWTDYATGADNIRIFDIIWNDISPTGEEFRALMKNAADVIDEYIASRL